MLAALEDDKQTTRKTVRKKKTAKNSQLSFRNFSLAISAILKLNM